MKQTDTQKDIARRLSLGQSPEFISQEMGIPLSHISLLKK